MANSSTYTRIVESDGSPLRVTVAWTDAAAFCDRPDVVKLLLEKGGRHDVADANGNGTAGELADLRNWMIGRLLWDPQADDQALLREFVTLHYRQAAGPLLEYVELLHDNAERRGVHPGCFPSPEEVGLDAELARRILGLFARAAAVAGEDQIRVRVDKASISAYRAMIATSAWSDDAERAALVARYIELGRQQRMTYASEGRLAEDYFAELQQSAKGG